MEITFNPHNPDDIAAVLSLPAFAAIIAAYDGDPVLVAETEDSIDVSMVTKVETTGTPQTTNDATGNADVDKHGMVWNDEYHSTPAKLNADGSFKMKRGCKEELEAAIEAHKQGKTDAVGAEMTGSAQTEETSQTGGAKMPSSTKMPSSGKPSGSATPTINPPPAVMDFETVANRFIALLEQFPDADHNVIYADLSIDETTFDTDQSAMKRLWVYMDHIDAGASYTDAVARGFAA